MFRYIFHTGSFQEVVHIFIELFFTLVAWVRDTDENLFLLCRSTAFELTFEESVNKHYLVGLCWCPRAFLIEQLHYKIPECFLERKILLILFDDCERNIYHPLGRYHLFSLEPKGSASF